MSLVKWFRKNNTKVMAIVVIVILFGFIGGGTLLQQLSRRRIGLHKAVAYLGENKKITNYDMNLARRELEILQRLGANDMLRSISVPLFPRTQDLQPLLLGELLFSDRRISPELVRRIKQMVRMNGYRVSDKQINDMYRRSMPSDIYWYCLKNEAQQAGIRISNKRAGSQLAKLIPQLFPGVTYSQLINSIMNPPSGVNRQGIPEREILATFGKLLAVLEYAKMICSNEAVTTRQIMQTASLEEEKIDVEFVKFDSAVFAETGDEPTRQAISAHFDKYKKFFAGAVSDENPYGFGYKLTDRVKLEYIAVRLDDVSGIVTAPTQEESEEFYQKNRERFTEQVLSDPNNPNSPLTERIKSYAEMASIISKGLLQNEINSKAEKILQEAKTLTEAGFEDTGTEPNLSAEQFAQMAGDYEAAAEELNKKYRIKVYAGQTGLLSAADMQADEYLARLYLTGYGYPVGLTQVVFAIDELGVSELGPFDVPKSRMYENIGPVRDMLGRVTAVVRVVEAQKASEPENVNQTFGKNTLRFEQDEELATEDVYSVKEKVAEDLKRLAAISTAKSKAEEFVKQVVKDGWEEAIEKFNELYGQQAKTDMRDPNVFGSEPFKLQKFSDLRRISRETIGVLAVQSAGDPAAQFLVNEAKKQGELVDRFYSLVPQDASCLEAVPLVMEFKPDVSYYCLKKICVKRLEQEQYEKIRAMRVYKEDFVQSQSLAAVHFGPENILKRMNFRPAKEKTGASDVNAPAESGGAS